MADEVSTPGIRVQGGAVIATGDGSETTRADYDTWGWKEIKARISGSAAVAKGMLVDSSAVRSDPNTFYNAAMSFRAAQELLSAIGRHVSLQARALAGDAGPWRGEAATAFLGLMEQFAKAFTNHANQLGGGPAQINPVPEQLWAVGDSLFWARREVHLIDLHYAEQARLVAAENGTDVVMDNGLTRVSEYPEIVEMLNQDMRKVLKILAAKYEEARFDTELMSVPTPNPMDGLRRGEHRPGYMPGGPSDMPPDFFRSTPPPNPMDGLRRGELRPGYMPGGPSDMPPDFFRSTPPPQFEPGAFDPGAAPGTSPGAFSPSASSPSPFSPSAFDPGAGTGQAPPGTSAFDPAAFQPDPFNPTAPPGSTPGAFTPPSFDSAPLAPAPGTAGTPPSITPFVPSFTPPSSGSGPGAGVTLPPASKPGTGSGAGVPEFQKPDLKPFTPSEMPKMPNVADWVAGDRPDGLGTPDQRGGGMPGGMPMMPPPMSPPAGTGGGMPERSDASGLVGGEIEPWKGAEIPGLGDPQGLAELPEGKPQEWTASSPVGSAMPGMPGGMPMSPPMSPPAGAGNGAQERSDASGLLGGEAAPWEGVAPPGVGEPEGFAETAERQDWAPGLTTPAVPGTPMAPPMSPPAGAGGGVAERSDASGLLGGEATAWESVPAPGAGEPAGLDAPAVAPEEWAVQQVPAPDVPVAPVVPPVFSAPLATLDGTQREEVSASPGAVVPGVPVAPVVPPVLPANTAGTPRGEAAALSGTASAAWESAPVPPQPDRDDDKAGAFGAVLPPDEPVEAEERIAVVRPADAEEDFGAWDVAAGSGLLWAAWAPGQQRDEDEEQPHTPDYVLRETTPWEHATNHAAARASSDVSATPVPSFADGAEFLPRAFDVPDGPLCGGDEAEQERVEAQRALEEARAAEEAEEEEKERTSADLLKQDDDAWAAAAVPTRPGVIE